MKKKEKRMIGILVLVAVMIIGIIYIVTTRENQMIINNKTNSEKMTDSSRITELEKQIDSLNKEHTNYAEYIKDSKTKLATAITNNGVATSANDTADTMAGNIGNILKEGTKDATATAEDIAKDKTAYVNGEKITGSSNSIGGDSITVLTNVQFGIGGTIKDGGCSLYGSGITISTQGYKYVDIVGATANGGYKSTGMSILVNEETIVSCSNDQTATIDKLNIDVSTMESINIKLSGSVGTNWGYYTGAGASIAQVILHN